MENISMVLTENEEKILPLVWTAGSGEITVNASLEGRGAKLSVLGALMLSGDDQLTVNINITHNAPDTFSDTLVKSVLSDKAQGKFYGLVSIKKGAKNTNTYFREDSLLLSKKAKAEAIPSLEIDENEVKAGHASTVGPIDSEQIFYLMSRGINQDIAKELIVKGYLLRVIEKFPKKEKEELETFLEKRFNNIKE